MADTLSWVLAKIDLTSDLRGWDSQLKSERRQLQARNVVVMQACWEDVGVSWSFERKVRVHKLQNTF